MNDKSNEITAVPDLLTLLDISGCVVTLDALNTQVAIAQQIVAAQADYILPVKDNQGTLHEDIAMLFDGFEGENYGNVAYETAKQVSEAPDRREIRQCWVVNTPDYVQYLRRGAHWPGLTSLMKLLTIRVSSKKTEVTPPYFISSWTASAQNFLDHIRQHWQIENGLHWVLDIAFREDESRIPRIMRLRTWQSCAIWQPICSNMRGRDCC